MIKINPYFLYYKRSVSGYWPWSWSGSNSWSWCNSRYWSWSGYGPYYRSYRSCNFLNIN